MQPEPTLCLGQAIRVRRHLLDISQEELAYRSRLHRSYITDLERGVRNPSLTTISRLADALRISLADLFRAAQSPAPDQNDTGHRTNFGSGIVELLLVEDNSDEADLVIRALSKCNFSNRIHLVRDGAEALDFLFCRKRYEKRPPKQLPHAVLLDLGLPAVNGLEVLQSIRSNSAMSDLPVVVLTSSSNPVNKIECQQLGVHAYIEKPFNFQEFSLVMPRIGMHWLLLDGPLRSESLDRHALLR